MVLDDRARYRMQRRLAETIDEETAVTLMAHLPPGGWTDVATTADIARIEGRLDAIEGRLDRMEGRLDRLEQRMMRMLVVFIGTTIGAVLATAGVVATVGGF